MVTFWRGVNRCGFGLKTEMNKECGGARWVDSATQTEDLPPQETKGDGEAVHLARSLEECHTIAQSQVRRSFI